METCSIQDVFSKNRAEEYGFDVWQHFVIPHFYEQIEFKKARKPILMIGGRGCGKTMLLRSLSYQSVFSINKPSIAEDELSHIGLYWRADTQFCNAMTKRGIDEDIWINAFNHFSSLIIGREILASLKSIAKSNLQSISEEDVKNIDFSRLKSYNSSLPTKIDSLYDFLENLLWEFEAWVNNVGKKESPDFLPGPNFIKAIIKIATSHLTQLVDAVFYIYVDEFENLATYQKKIINTWLKHSEVPLIFNLAMRKNVYETKKTLSEESLSDIHDYRKYDLEQLIKDNNFPVFAAEILFLQLSQRDLESPIDINILRDINCLATRRSPEYSERVLSAAQGLFPDLSHEELAIKVFEDAVLLTKLKELIAKALISRKSKLNAEDFILKDHPMASIVSPALIYRDRLKAEDILDQLRLLSSGKENNFTGKRNWNHNNFIGCLLQLYAPYSRACPFFAGFMTFCKISRGNLRHLLELSHLSFRRSSPTDQRTKLPVDPIRQAEAARQASAAFLGEIRSFGPLGEKMHSFVLRIGTIFQLANRRSTQSESEISHFSIRRGKAQLGDEDHRFIAEAVKWSVLFEYEETKKKEDYLPESIEYILNPIYTPYFHISYRKKRKLDLSSDDIKCLVSGSLDEFTSLLKTFKAKWTIDTEKIQPSLFSLLQ